MNHLQRLKAQSGAREGRAIYHLVVETLFGMSMTDVLLGKDTELSANDRKILENTIGRILEGEPVQYVLGEAWFKGLRYVVTPAVLIPRPETEQLVDLALQAHPSPVRMLDIGTGSGCIAISLALKGHQTWGMDISEDALAVAQENAVRLGAVVHWLRADIRSIPPTSQQWEAIVSNPPYICEREKSEMESHVVDHEPPLALFVPDRDPLLFYRAITDFALMHLTDQGTIHFETNMRYAEEVKKLLAEKGFSQVRVIRDLYGKPRMVEGQKTGEQG